MLLPPVVINLKTAEEPDGKDAAVMDRHGLCDFLKCILKIKRTADAVYQREQFLCHFYSVVFHHIQIGLERFPFRRQFILLCLKVCRAHPAADVVSTVHLPVDLSDPFFDPADLRMRLIPCCQ